MQYISQWRTNACFKVVQLYDVCSQSYLFKLSVWVQQYRSQSYGSSKAFTKNLFREGGVFSRPFLSPPFLPFIPLFLHLEMAPQIQLKDWGSAFSPLPPAVQRTKMRLRLSPGRKRILVVFRAQGTSGGNCKRRLISVKANPKLKPVNLFLNILLYYCVIAYLILRD